MDTSLVHLSTEGVTIVNIRELFKHVSNLLGKVRIGSREAYSNLGDVLLDIAICCSRLMRIKDLPPLRS
jgi:hypothetical protein